MANTGASLSKPPPGTALVQIAVVGSIHMDFINFVEQHSSINGHVRSKRSLQVPGGHGANQAAACAKLNELPRNFLIYETTGLIESSQPSSGLKVSMFGAVGDQDRYGDKIKEELRQNKVNVDNVATIEGEVTGYAHVTVDEQGGFKVIHTPGASEKYLPGPFFNDKSLKPDVVLVQLEIEERMVLHALKWAKDQKAMTICNAAPATRTVSDEIFKVDHFIVNEQQADTLNGCYEKPFSPADRINKRAEIRQHYQELCEKFHENGATCVVITLAELGVVASRRDPNSRIQQRYVFDAEQGPRPVKDTTGAADVFIGGYTIGLIHQKQAGLIQDMAPAIRLGIKAAGLSVSWEGSMRAIPTPEEIMKTEFRAVGD